MHAAASSINISRKAFGFDKDFRPLFLTNAKENHSCALAEQYLFLLYLMGQSEHAHN